VTENGALSINLMGFSFVDWRGDVFEDLNHGRLNLALIGDEGHVPTLLQTEAIFEEEFVCILAADAPYLRQLTIKQYPAAECIGDDVVEGSLHMPDNRLAAHDHRECYRYFAQSGSCSSRHRSMPVSIHTVGDPIHGMAARTRSRPTVRLSLLRRCL
jgi:DNA-binding transcriptional LysR family regulator